MIVLEPSESLTIDANDGDTMSVVSSIVDVVIAGEISEESQQNDQIQNSYTSATVRKDRQIIAATSLGNPITLTSLDESKATVTPSGYVQSVGTGSVAIRVRSRLTDKHVNHTSQTVGGQTTTSFDRYADDTLGKAINEAVDALAALSQSKQVLSAINNTTPSYTRNASCWITADKTCWPVWGSTSGNLVNGCLISPRHMLFANHARPANGSTLRFLTNANQVITRTVGSAVSIGSFDLSIGVLTEDVPSSITFAKVLPSDWQDYLTIGSVPLIAGDQELKLIVRDWNLYSDAGSDCRVAHSLSTSSVRLPLTETIIGGDSGSPLFLLIDDELVAIGCHFTAVGCPLISGYYTAVNAAMSSLGGGYQLTPIDLSNYTSFA